MKRKKSWLEILLSPFKKNKPAYVSMAGVEASYSVITASSEFNTPSDRFTGLTPASFIPSIEDQRIAKKPVEVFNEIIAKTPALDLTNLDAKIKVVKKRIEVLRDFGGIQVGEDEKKALKYLEARKLFMKHGPAFVWPVTTMKMVNDLCSKYKLMLVSLQGYYKCVPAEGVEEIKKFSEAFAKVTKEGDPVFRLIVDVGGKEQKKDPILLADAPFGDWLYVLGAWDKEIEVVDALVYHGK